MRGDRYLPLNLVTTIVALLPDALALGAVEHVFQPFAVTVIAGLTVGTLTTLTVLRAAVSPSLAQR